jgi:two-component system, NarL family, nitrate/nitrite response regulator NarL
MDLMSSNTDLRPNSSMKDDCTFAATWSPRVTSLSDVYATPEEGCPSSVGVSAVCRAVILSERGLFLDGLRDMLGKSRISVIGEAQNIPGLLAAMQTQPVPELVICHIPFDRKPDAALHLISGLRQHFAGAKLVVLADACTTSLLSSIAGADVSAILLTSISSDMLLQSLKLVLFDHRLFPSEIMPLITGSSQARPNFGPAAAESLTRFAETAIGDRAPQVPGVLPYAPAPDPQSTVPLSKRESQVMDCLVKGWSNKMIARELNIVEATVKVYLKCLSRKIKVSNRTQLAIWALRQHRLFDADDVVGPVGAEASITQLHTITSHPNRRWDDAMPQREDNFEAA